MNYTLSELPPLLKKLCLMILFILSVGVGLGIYYISISVGTSPQQIDKHYNGSKDLSDEEFQISYQKNVKEITLTVHNHVLSFALIFSLLSIIFYGVQSISPKLKEFLLIEPFISILTTFGSMYLIRFVHESFVYLMILSSTVLYGSFFLMVYFSVRELRKK